MGCSLSECWKGVRSGFRSALDAVRQSSGLPAFPIFVMKKSFEYS